MRSTEKNKPLFLAAKGFISFFMLFSAYYSYSHAHELSLLGFPDYFRVELVIAKVIGAVVLLIPRMPSRVKDWVYTGFLIAMFSALIAHICSNDPLSKIIFVLIDLFIITACIRYVSKYDRAEANQLLFTTKSIEQ